MDLIQRHFARTLILILAPSLSFLDPLEQQISTVLKKCKHLLQKLLKVKELNSSRGGGAASSSLPYYLSCSLLLY